MANNRWAIALSPHLEIQTGMRNGQEMFGERQKILYVRPPFCDPQQPTSPGSEKKIVKTNNISNEIQLILCMCLSTRLPAARPPGRNLT